MRIRKFACAVTVALLAAGCGTSAFAAGTTQTGKVSLKLETVRAVLPTGSNDPAHDKDCTEQLKQPSSRYVGLPVTTTYSIDPKTLIESATSSFPSPNSLKPIQLSVKMSALGLAGVYAFGAFKPPALPNGDVRFRIGLDFKNPVSIFLVANPPNVGYNCVISSGSSVLTAEDVTAPAAK